MSANITAPLVAKTQMKTVCIAMFESGCATNTKAIVCM